MKPPVVIVCKSKLRAGRLARKPAGSKRPVLGSRQRDALQRPGVSWRQRLLWLTTGGRWSEQLSLAVGRNLRWFWLDGVLAQASEVIALDYLAVFALALGASRAQIGLMSSLSSLSAALVLLYGASLVERWGRSKQICLLSGGGVARFMLLLLALVPLVFAGPAAVYVIIALAIARSAFANLSVPAWTCLTATIVPLSWRGRYFSSRNMAMGVAGMVTTYGVGYLITQLGDPIGYQWAMGLAFVIGMASTWSFARIEEPAASATWPVTGSVDRLSLLRHLQAHPSFLAFCATAALWNFSLNIAGPFFGVYLVENLQASAGAIGTLSVISSLTALPGQRLFGVWVDRWGPRRVQLVTGLLIPGLPWAWMFTRSPWHAAPINLVGGFLWAGYSLASFNFLLTLAPEDRRPRYTALYQMVVTVALAGGAALGGVIAMHWGYQTVFGLSGLGRLGAALLFVLLVREPAPEK